MALTPSLSPEIDAMVRSASPVRRIEAALKISDLYRQGASRFQPQHVELFDGVLIGLIAGSDIAVRAELAARMAELANAPPTLIGRLVRDDEIRIAGPLLRYSPMIDDGTLDEIGQAQGQGHLIAMSMRKTLSAPITDLLLRRGERDVVRSVAGNEGARFSHMGYATLIKRSAIDGVLANMLGQRGDLSDAQLRNLMENSVGLVRQRLFEAASPERKAAINRVLDDLPGAQPIGDLGERNFAQAQRAILALHRSGELEEARLFEFARAYRYEYVVASLSMMTGIKLTIVDHLISGDRHDPLLIMGKSLGFSWATVKALIVLRTGGATAPQPALLEEARENYERLVPVTAQRVLNFWKSRKG